MVKTFFLLLVISLLTLPVASFAKISNTNELIAAMQKRYGKSWYKTATFVQETINIQPDGTSKVETWYEAMSGWIAPEVIFLVDGKVVTTEKYSEIRGDVTLDPKLFDPQFWTTVHWKQ